MLNIKKVLKHYLLPAFAMAVMFAGLSVSANAAEIDETFCESIQTEVICESVQDDVILDDTQDEVVLEDTQDEVLPEETQEKYTDEDVQDDIFNESAQDETVLYGTLENGEVVTTEIVDLGSLTLDPSPEEFGDMLSFDNASTGQVDLYGGNYEKWKERAILPGYAKDLYNYFVEASDNDGNYDHLLADYVYRRENATTINYGSYYGKDVFYAYKVTTVKNPSYNERNYIYRSMRAAYDCFLMDHPEVFWLSGSSLGYAVISNNTYTFYFILKMHDGSYSDSFDIRESSYRSESTIKSDIKRRDNAVKAILNASSIKNARNEYELVKAFNSWLIRNNEYNTAPMGYEGKWAHNCLSALLANIGTKGPVCEGYAKAMKVLCDKKNIACVLTTSDDHMWNSVRMNGIWYEVDVTWNDPSGGYSAPLSGYENEDFLLVGKDTVIHGSQFDQSHITTNNVSTTGVWFTNGPIISPTKYVHKYGSTSTPSLYSVDRIAGSTRYGTSMAIAYKMMEKANVNKLNSVIIASGTNFADALAGSYLAEKRNAPILMTNGKNKTDIKNFISKNLAKGGSIYILGGTGAVSEDVKKALYGLGTIERLSGADRYATNLAILAEAGVGNEDLLVCTGKSFADSLSASATKKPLLLVNNKDLTGAQKSLLNRHNGKIYIIGGTGVISSSFESKLKAYGKTERIGGNNRYDTSVRIANKFFASPKTAVIAYAKNFPDGLCGGPLAMLMDAPLILTANGNETKAVQYMRNKGVHAGYVLGGTSLISNYTANQIFGR